MTRAERLAAALAGGDAAAPGEIMTGAASLMTPVSQVASSPAHRFEAMDGGASPIRSRVLGWCRFYVARGVSTAWLAWAFNLDADDLNFALNGGGR